MEDSSKRNYLIMSLLAILIIVLIFLNTNSQVSLASAENLEECKTIAFNDEHALNLVFFSPEGDAREYSEYLLDSEPFKDYPNSFNFFYIDSYKPECELYKGIAIYCHSRELIKKAASCPYDYIAVLDEMESKIRSSVYQNVMSINTNHPKSVFLHEFGHAFANLAEEYAPARIPRGSKNCKTKCGKFEGEIDGCFHECSNSGHHRSIENGVMRTLSTDDYGIYNDKIISELIENSISKDSQITGAVISESFKDCKNKHYFMADVDYKDGRFKSKGVSKHRGCSPNPSHRLAGDFKLEDGTHFTPNLICTMSSEDKNYGTYEEPRALLVVSETSKRTISITDPETGESLGQISLPSTGGNLLCKD